MTLPDFYYFTIVFFFLPYRLSPTPYFYLTGYLGNYHPAVMGSVIRSVRRGKRTGNKRGNENCYSSIIVLSMNPLPPYD